MAPSLIDYTDSSHHSVPDTQKSTTSIQTVLDEIHKGNPKFSELIPQLYKQTQAQVDPPLESIWVYAALTFRSQNHPKDHALGDLVSAAKDLFQLVLACSVPSSSSKSVALLAPVVRLMYDVVLELFNRDLGLKKREKKVMKQVKNLVGVILGFVNVCCSSNEDSDSDLGWSFSRLSCVWLDRNEGVEKLLPLVSEGVIGGLTTERDGDVSYLAGVVIAEVFLLKLCLICKAAGSSRLELEKELRTWAVGSITGFGNAYLFDVLIRMLLEKTLPVTSLLSSEDEVLLRKVLYDAIILVEYSFLNPGKATNVPTEHMKIIAMRRLILAHEAVEYFREHGDQRRSISYTTAFSSSQLYSQIVKCVKCQMPVEDSSVKSKGTSPTAVLKWLLNLERQGFLVFGDSILKYHSLDISKLDFNPPGSKLGTNGMDDGLLFYMDNKRREEDTDDEKVKNYVSAAFVAAAHTMTSAEKRGLKRKGDHSESDEESSLSDEDSE